MCIANAARHLVSIRIPMHCSDHPPNQVLRSKFHYGCTLDTDPCLFFSFNQTSLNGIITREHRNPMFTNVGLMDHLVELIIREDEVSESHLFVRASH